MSDLQKIFNGGFNANSVEPQKDFEVLPPGKYPVMVEKAEVKQTKKQDGHYIELTLCILDGTAKNRKLWDRINIQNPNATCTEIGLRCLAALAQAIGINAVSNTDQLVGRSCLAHVKVKDEQNEIRTYSKFDDFQSVQPQSTPYPHTPAPTSQGASLNQSSASMPGPRPEPTIGYKPPWARQ
jgi:hypothetical protein